jgi:recombination protein RecA
MIGSRTRVKVVKNKVAPPFKQAEFDIMYGHGISREGDVLDCAVEAKLVEKAGAWYSYRGERIGQGRENVKNYLIEHKDMLAQMEADLKENYRPTVKPAVDEDGVIIE